MIYLFLILSLIFPSSLFAQTFQVTNQGQHPYRHIPRDLNSGSDNAADEECATYEGSTGLFEWQTCSGGGGSVTSVTASAPLASSGGTTPNITVQNYTGSENVVLNNSPTMTGVIVNTTLQIPSDTSPVTDTIAEVAVKIDGWASGRGPMQGFDGTATTYSVDALASDAPADGQVPKWNTGGTITWENDNNSAGITATDTHVIYSDGANNPVGDADLTWNKTTNILTSTGGFQSGASANPTLSFKDSSTTDADVNSSIQTNCTRIGSGVEDCDVIISRQSSGTLSPVITVDADYGVVVTGLVAATNFTLEQVGGTDIMTGAAGGIKVTGNAQITQLVSCDTIDTDANGIMSCGTDSGGGGSGDITDVGDCTGPACFNGTSGTTLTFNNAGGDGDIIYDGNAFGFYTPNSQITVENNATSSITAGGRLILTSDDAAALSNNDQLGKIDFVGSTNASGGQNDGASIRAYTTGGWSETSLPTKLSFYTVPSTSTTQTLGMELYATGLTVAVSPSFATITPSRFITSNLLSTLSTSGSSADLAATLTDETGTTGVVFSKSPIMTDITTQTTFTLEQTNGTDIMTGAVGGIRVAGNIQATYLASCDTIDTDSNGIMRCGNDGGGGGGDSITVNSSAATDPDFANGDVDWTLTGGNSITATVGCTDCVALSTETSGNYVSNVTAPLPLYVRGTAGEGWTPDVFIKDYTGTNNVVYNNAPTMTGITTQTTFTLEQTNGTDIMTGAIGGIKVTGNMQSTYLASCNAIKTDSNGIMRCSNDFQRFSFVISSPTAASDFEVGSFPANITINKIRVLSVGGTNVVGGLQECNGSGASCSAVDADITAPAGSVAFDDGSLSNPTIDADDQLQWLTTSVSGSPTRVVITIYFTYDLVQ